MIRIKHVYELPKADDGFRILVDRMWPRGLSKEKAAVDLWLKEIAPSSSLRKWFGHDASKWEAFKQKYSEELKSKRDLITTIQEKEKEYHTITLVFAAKDEEHNNAVALLTLIHP